MVSYLCSVVFELVEEDKKNDDFCNLILNLFNVTFEGFLNQG